MGNTVVWKPASTAAYSAHFIMRLLREAGLPDGVINLVYGPGRAIGDAALAARTWPASTSPARRASSSRCGRRSANNIERYRNYPRIVGETAARTSSSPTRRPTWTRSPPRSCAAPSSTRARSAPRPRACSYRRTSGPSSKERLVEEVAQLKMGDVADFQNFMGAVIDSNSFRRSRRRSRRRRPTPTPRSSSAGRRRRRGLLRRAHGGRDARPQLPPPARRALRPGGDGVRLSGREWQRHARRRRQDGSPYGLTGAIFSDERAAIDEAEDKLEYAAGNLLHQRQADRRGRGAAALRRRRARRARTTRRARCGTSSAGSRRGRSRRPSTRRADYRYPFMDPDTARDVAQRPPSRGRPCAAARRSARAVFAGSSGRPRAPPASRRGTARPSRSGASARAGGRPDARAACRRSTPRAASRRCRWNSSAKRCASSRIRCRSWSAGEWRSSTTGSRCRAGTPPPRASPARSRPRAAGRRPASPPGPPRAGPCRRPRRPGSASPRRIVVFLGGRVLRRAKRRRTTSAMAAKSSWPSDPAHAELAVVRLLRQRVLEDDHGADGRRALEVGDVEALDPDRQALEVERLAELLQRLDAAQRRCSDWTASDSSAIRAFCSASSARRRFSPRAAARTSTREPRRSDRNSSSSTCPPLPAGRRSAAARSARSRSTRARRPPAARRAPALRRSRGWKL